MNQQPHWQAYQQACEQQQIAIPDHADFAASFAHVCACSQFVAQICIQHPAVILDLYRSGDILREYPEGDYHKRLSADLQGINDIAELMQTLRQRRRREMLRIAWRDLSSWAMLDEVLRDLSDLADSFINTSLAKLYTWQCQREGTPLDAKQQPMPLWVIAMGKLGGRELNFSSDIDVLFAYADDGMISDSQYSHQQFFTRLAQQLIKVLHTMTDAGFVYRVDARLRPYGKSGALVNSLASLMHYYTNHGRDWERYALCKARITRGSTPMLKRLQVALRNFVYPRHIDFTMIESMRQLQQTIHQNVHAKDLVDNVKRGPGGIREVEFIAQTYKLIHGGWHHHLQLRNTLRSLHLLGELGYLTDENVARLTDSYRFLRKVENRLQMFADTQTQALPTDTTQRDALLLAMQLPNWQQFYRELNERRHYVHETFESLIAKPNLSLDDPVLNQLRQPFLALWQGELSVAAAQLLLHQQGVKQAETVMTLLQVLRESQAGTHLSPRQLERLHEVIPHLLIRCTRHADTDVVMLRVLGVVESLLQQAEYLALLIENPMAAKHLVHLCAASSWVAEQITRFPSLLKQLISAQVLYRPPALAALRQELQQVLVGIPEDNIDAQLHAIRGFKQAHVLRVAAADITGNLPLMKVSDYLTWIATVVLEAILQLASEQLVKQYNYHEAINLAIIGYGKLGGIELGYASDLDLVFLYDAEPLAQQAGIDTSVFYTRLAQQVINLLTEYSEYGRLYAVDLRLRPSGDSGLLVNSMSGWLTYQQEQAWLWEHQALVRARYITGNPALGERFDQLRQQILAQALGGDKLRQGVRAMREKLRASHREEKGIFSLKRSKGGIIDIEFLVQYGVIRWASKYPSLLQWTDNIRLLEEFAVHSLLPTTQIRLLSDAYRRYRAVAYHNSLQNQAARVADSEFVTFRQGVQQIYDEVIGY